MLWKRFHDNPLKNNLNLQKKKHISIIPTNQLLLDVVFLCVRKTSQLNYVRMLS